MKIRRQATITGATAMIGSIGQAITDFEDEGRVKVGAEIWRATSDDPIAAGEKVSISEVDGLLLTVTKIEGEKS